MVGEVKPTQFMKPFRYQPKPGQRVKVFMKDGSTQMALCINVESHSGFCGLQWYDTKTRKAININNIKGWLPGP